MELHNIRNTRTGKEALYDRCAHSLFIEDMIRKNRHEMMFEIKIYRWEPAVMPTIEMGHMK